MKALHFLLLSLAFCAAEAFAFTKDLDLLQACVEEVKVSNAQFTQRLPHEVFNADRRLYHMSLGIPFLEQNFLKLKERLAANDSPLDRLLLSNALEACYLFGSQYRARALRFSSVLVAILALLGVLTLRVFSSIVPPYANANKTPSSDTRAAS